MLTIAFYELDKRFDAPFLSKHKSFQIGIGFPPNLVPRDALKQSKWNFRQNC